jgi:hypothetical protein
VCVSGAGPGVADAATSDASTGAIGGCWAHWRDGSVTIEASSVQALEEQSGLGGNDFDPWISKDGLSLYYTHQKDPGASQIYVTKRTSTMELFKPPGMPVGSWQPVNAVHAALTDDETTLVLASDQDMARFSLYLSARDTMGKFSVLNKQFLGNVDTANMDQSDPFLNAGGTRLYLALNPPANPQDQSIFVASRTNEQSDFDPPVAAMDSDASSDADPALSPDELVLVFSSPRPGAGHAGVNLWYATRRSMTERFGMPFMQIPTVNSDDDDEAPMPTRDGCELYFSRVPQNPPGGQRKLYVAKITP